MKTDCGQVFPKWNIAARGFKARVYRQFRRLQRCLRQHGSLKSRAEQDPGQAETEQGDRFYRAHFYSLAARLEFRCAGMHTAAATVRLPLRDRPMTSLKKPGQPRTLPGRQCTSLPMV